jgi:hypothetical protein
MDYKFTDDYRIKISGKPKDLKMFIKELSTILDGGTGYTQIEEDIEGLEKIINPKQYTFGVYHRIYYNNKEVIYTPNVSGEEARKFHFNIFKKTFDEVIKNINNKQL